MNDAINPFISPTFPYEGQKRVLQEKGTNPFSMVLRTDIKSIAAPRITAAHYLFGCFLHASSLVGRNLFPTIIPSAFPVVDKDVPNRSLRALSAYEITRVPPLQRWRWLISVGWRQRNRYYSRMSFRVIECGLERASIQTAFARAINGMIDLVL
ncbi:MAG TPA: hypothetical protein VMZ24_04620 [Patescibacteria group bacterium]|nr:hypothetical protein [Patescibacteria group bacterium]